jgi:hypothetical protein
VNENSKAGKRQNCVSSGLLYDFYSRDRKVSEYRSWKTTDFFPGIDFAKTSTSGFEKGKTILVQ